jgi:GNAT superfamily N-acetyltransferase
MLSSMKTTPELPSIEIPFDDGAVATLRPIVADDAPLIEEGLERLSEASRFARFGMGIDRLSKSELQYLSDVDQRSHVAFGVMIDGEPAGVGRYVVIPGGRAEVALTVVDEFQRRGVGRLLFMALLAVARRDGVDTFCFEVTPSNEPVRLILRAAAGNLVDPGFDEGEISLASLPTDDMDADVAELIERYRS